MSKPKEDIKFKYDENNNIKEMTIIHYTDHGNPKTHPNPHAHDIDVNHSVNDFDNAWGKARPLRDDEK